MEINRLTITTESRILGDEYVRFGGEYIETCFHKGKKGALCLAIGTCFGNFVKDVFERSFANHKNVCREFSMRSARNLICCSLSSPLTYSTFFSGILITV